MKKKLVLILVICFCCLSLTGCDEYDFWGAVFSLEHDIDDIFFDGEHNKKAEEELRAKEEQQRLKDEQVALEESESTALSSTEVTTSVAEATTEVSTESSLVPSEAATEVTTEEELSSNDKDYNVDDCDWIFVGNNRIPIKITVPDGYFVFTDENTYEISSDTSYLTFQDSGITSSSVMNDVLIEFASYSDSDDKVVCETKKVKGKTIYYSQYVTDSGLELLAFQDIGENSYLQINLTSFEGVVPQELMNSLALDLD